MYFELRNILKSHTNISTGASLLQKDVSSICRRGFASGRQWKTERPVRVYIITSQQGWWKEACLA